MIFLTNDGISMARREMVRSQVRGILQLARTG
jgi:hypothetical protein